jgi:cell wall assembly regulator SMI1
MKDDKTTNLWDRFEAMLARHAPALLASLRPGASLAQIGVAEQSMGLRLPDDVRRAYLRHDGTARQLIPPFCYWASLAEMSQQHARLVDYNLGLSNRHPELYGPSNAHWDTQKVKPVAGNDKWVPIGLTDTSTAVYVDLDPAPLGTIGQLIKDDGMCDPMHLASGFDGFLAILIDRVERGILIYRDWQWVWTETDEPAYDWESMLRQ